MYIYIYIYQLILRVFVIVSVPGITIKYVKPRRPRVNSKNVNLSSAAHDRKISSTFSIGDIKHKTNLVPYRG